MIHYHNDDDEDLVGQKRSNILASKIKSWWKNLISRPKQPRFEERYELVKKIGQGEFGKVWVAKCKKTGELVIVLYAVAVKLIQTGSSMNQSRCKRIEREISILRTLSHPKIVKIYEIYRKQDYLAVVMEYVVGGELFDFIQTKGHLPESLASDLFRQLINSIDYIHSRGIVHRDLKLENILINKDRQLALTDFGFANFYRDKLSQKIQLVTSCGSPCYAAPELVLEPQGYIGPPVDVWSCGVVLFAMLYGYLPFESEVNGDLERDPNSNSPVWTSKNVYQLYMHIQSHPLTLPAEPKISSAAADLLRRMLQANPKKRIHLEDIMTHPWLLTMQNST